MATAKRDSNGRFLPGTAPGPGRPPRVAEEAYLRTLTEVCTLEEWKAICERAVRDAKAGDATARNWLAKYLLANGKTLQDVAWRERFGESLWP